MTDIIFLYLLLPVSVLFSAVRARNIKKAGLIIISLAFLAINGLYSGIFIAFMSCLVYLLGRFCSKKILPYVPAQIIVVVINIAALFAANTAVRLEIKSFLPLAGLSFFALNSLVYLKEAGTDKTGTVHTFSDCLLYLTFFPKVLLGPVISYKRFVSLFNTSSYSADRAAAGLKFFVFGAAKKVLFADFLFGFCSSVWESRLSDLSTGILCFTSFSYLLYIILLFSSYSSMARGLCLVFGVFVKPSSEGFLLCDNLRKFSWSWNISAVNFFDRNIASRTEHDSFMNKALPFIIWLAYGTWFGFDLSSFVFGALMGILLVLERTFMQRTLRKPNFFYRMVVMLILSLLFTLLFPKSDIYIFDYMRTLFSASLPIWNQAASYYLREYFLVIALSVILAFEGEKLDDRGNFDFIKNRQLSSFLSTAAAILLFVAVSAILIFKGGAVTDLILC